MLRGRERPGHVRVQRDGRAFGGNRMHVVAGIRVTVQSHGGLRESATLPQTVQVVTDALARCRAISAAPVPVRAGGPHRR